VAEGVTGSTTEVCENKGKEGGISDGLKALEVFEQLRPDIAEASSRRQRKTVESISRKKKLGKKKKSRLQDKEVLRGGPTATTLGLP